MELFIVAIDLPPGVEPLPGEEDGIGSAFGQELIPLLFQGLEPLRGGDDLNVQHDTNEPQALPGALDLPVAQGEKPLVGIQREVFPVGGNMDVDGKGALARPLHKTPAPELSIIGVPF